MNKPKRKRKKKWRRVVDNRMHPYGETDFDKHLIRVNKKKSRKNPKYTRPVNKHANRYPDVLGTIAHEEKHRKSPKMKEKNVAKYERRIVKKLSKQQKKRYYSLFA